MSRISSIVTIGLSPAWDITCEVKDLRWGQHKDMDSYSEVPAGKALNISRALAWMRQENTSAGLWGRSDYERAIGELKKFDKYINVSFTPVDGSTRKNPTIIDTQMKREFHLRSANPLATTKNLKILKKDISRLVKKHSLCIFSGSMPNGKALDEILKIIDLCYKKEARIVVDTSGVALKRIVKTGKVWLIKPNVKEFNELIGGKVQGNTKFLANKASSLLNRVSVVLISSGKKGAVVVSNDGVWQGWCISNQEQASTTVACGDFLLAGFVKVINEGGKLEDALETGIQTATARAWKWEEKFSWSKVRRNIQVRIKKL